MPHKHTRKGGKDDRHFNLAPSTRAKPLPAFEGKSGSAQNGDHDRKPNLKRKRDTASSYGADDTPRAFARLMQAQSGKKQRTGLDDGKAKHQKQVKAQHGRMADVKSEKIASTETATLQILPGESMSTFSARVNQALPVGGLARTVKQQGGAVERQTKTEKRLKRMYAEWREEDARRKEKQEELLELEEDAADEQAMEYNGQSIELPASRRQKRKRLIGEVEDNDTDPWAVLKSKREKPRGLHDVVQAPPTLEVVPREKFKVRDGAHVDVANVPNKAGSLNRREALGDARREVIERYRNMMKSSQ